MSHRPAPPRPPAGARVAACDLGKATARFVVGRLAADGGLELERAEERPHDGHVLEVFREWYRREEIASCAALGATGLHATGLVAPAHGGLPEDACLEAALSAVPELGGGSLNLVSIGARGYAVLSRDARGRVRYVENDKCSSGTGETMVKIAARFGLRPEEADALACGATAAIPITARCSVFAKSEMTHFGNQGRPADALFRGYFESVATYVAALLGRVRVPGPVWVVGGGSRLRALVDALGRVLGEPVRIPAQPGHLEAIGALRLAAEHAGNGQPPLPPDADTLVRPRRVRFAVLPPASESASRVTRLPAASLAADSARRPAILGLDLGSTGSKAALTCIETGDLLADVYDRTRGNPVEAARRLVEAILAHDAPDVRAVALTGSGREAAATVLRATYPERSDRIFVQNEIVAHATAAIRCDPDGGADLSIVEIGGQDAKYIQVTGGQIVESDMNKACSAGTGSFLEEQALFYGVREIEEFTRLARQATRPPDLGQMCTVFVADAAAEAHGQGFGLADLFGGFQYGVIHNYLNRVMGQRTFGRKIFFQGMPATGESLAWTLAAVTGREVIVPPNPGAMGAWGIGLCAREALGIEALAQASPFELPRLRAAAVAARAEFQCKDPRCATLCRIERTTVEVGGAKQTVFSGGACPKFEISTAAKPKLPVEAPSAFDERRALLEPYVASDTDGKVVDLPLAGAIQGYLPWLVTFLRGLGLGVRVLAPDARALARGEARCASYDACAPVKVAHGVAEEAGDLLFFPKLLSLGDPDGPGGRTCPMEQGLPEMVREALRSRARPPRVVSPRLSLGKRLLGPELLWELRQGAAQLGVPARRVPGAQFEAARAQRAYEEGLREIGERTLRYAREHRVPVVVLCGALHVIHDALTNAGLPHLLRENGVLPLPMDCLPIGAGVPVLPRIAWGDANRALRAAVTARGHGDVYPLWLSSFGCGPGSFAEQVFASLCEGHPHTVLESDGHGGTAGYVTRIQAFLHAVRSHDRRPSEPPARALRRLEPLPDEPIRTQRDSRFVVFSFTDRISPMVAAIYRSFGFDAVAAGPPGEATLSLGRQDCSGKECLPYQLIWGAFREHLEAHPPQKRTLLLQVTGQGMCRNCMFSVKDQIGLGRLGLEDQVALRHVRPEPDLGPTFLAKIWAGVVAWDLLYQLAGYHRPAEQEPAGADRLYARYADQLGPILERPVRAGLGGLPGIAATVRALGDLLEDAALAFRRLERRDAGAECLPRVFLSGDIYLRADERASDHLVRRLNERGLRVIPEPVATLFEYMAHERLSELMGLPQTWLDNAVVRHGAKRIRSALYPRVQRHHPWLPPIDLTGILERSRQVLDRYPQGEAPVTVGSVLHHWYEGWCDGVVVVSPWGCGPALVSESLLRHRADIPLLFVYSDGSPVDERRLNAFAFRLRRHGRPGRSPAHVESVAVEDPAASSAGLRLSRLRP